MKNNRKLLTEAIADAKAVKETAIQNAKAALEEAFTPQLKSMLSQRLAEMEEDENMDEMDEYTTPASSKKNKKYVSPVSETDEADEVDEMDELYEADEVEETDETDEMDELYETDEADEADEADEVDLEELLAELEELDEDEDEEDFVDYTMGRDDDDQLPNPPQKININLDEAEAEEEGEETEDEEEVDIDALMKSPEDFKQFVEDIVRDIMGEEGTEEETEEESEEEETEETEAKPIDEYTLDELLAELKSVKKPKVEKKKNNKKEKVEEIFGKLAAKFSGREGEEERRKELFDKTKEAVLDAGLDTPEKWGKSWSSYKTVDDIINKYLDNPDGAKYDSYKGTFRINGGEGNASLTWKKELTGLEKVASGSKGAVSITTRESLELKGELAEAYSVINTLRNELNEVNLLNAKLLYTNKIFKNRSLNETQKVKVLTAFDKANSVKEAKLVYETLLENLKTTKPSVNESLGFASKAMGTSTKTPIVESNMMVDRFKKLAGII